MNNLSLLFDYKGTISAQQFKRGIYIVCVICLLSITLNLFSALDYIALTDIEWSVGQTSIQTFFNSFTPSLIYFSFILLYSSLVLGIKRGRTLGLSLLKRNAYGILIFLFFNILSIIITEILPIIISSSPEENYSEMKITYGIITLICTIVLIGGTFIIIYLSKAKKNESNHSMSTSKVKYTTLILLFLAVLLIEIVFYGSISFRGFNLSPIEQTLITEFKNLVIYTLTVWIAFRIIIPNNKEVNTQLFLWENQIIKLLFYWRGSITKREFWCGIIIIFLSALYLGEGTVWQEIESAVVNHTYQGESFWASTTLLSVLYWFIPSFFPYGCVIFYSSSLVSIKRCRALHMNTFWGYVVGISAYLSIVSIQGISNFPKEIEPKNPFFNPAVWSLLLFFITFFINIIGIIVLSQSTKSDNNHLLNDNNPVRYIINNGWLILSYIIITILIRFFPGSKDYDLHLIIKAVIYIMYIVIFIFLSMDRLKNAGLSQSLSSITVAVFLLSLVIYYGLYEYGSFADSPKAYAFGRFETSLITDYISAFYFILFLLPSKSKNEA